MKTETAAPAPQPKHAAVKADPFLSIRKTVLTVVMTVFALLMIVPFIWMISTSFKTPSEVFLYPIRWIPASFNLDHHIKVWSGPESFAVYYLNSLKVSLISTVGAVFLSAIAAYGFARIEFKGREPLFVVFLCMMLVPPQVRFVPKFV